MRTLVLASLALLPACLIGTGDILGGDNKVPGVCGDGVINSGETCDDGNTASGDGCSAMCQTESTTTPRIDVALDKMNVATELNKTETLHLTLTGQNGFVGSANLTASLIDSATSAAVPKVTIDIPASADLSSGTATVPITITIPSDTTGAAIAANLRIDVTSSVAPQVANAPFAIDRIITFDYPDGTGGTGANHPMIAASLTILRGTLIHMHNSDTTVTQHIIHGDGSVFPHEEPRGPDTTTQIVGSTYEVPTIQISPGSTGQLGCHSHESAAQYMVITVM